MDLGAIEDAHRHQIVEQALIKEHVPEEEDVEVLHPAHLQHVRGLGNICDVLSLRNSNY